MRLFSLLPVSLLAAVALGQGDGLPPPGSPALTYTDGAFTEPNGGTSSYTQGNKMNISWTSVYPTVDIYLITGYEWANIIQLTTNQAQPWFQWEVTTDSKNSSEIYVFRGVNGTGTADQKATGGFLSAAFRIPVKDTPDTTATYTTLSTSASEPEQTSETQSTQTKSDTNPTETNPPSAGLTEGAKIGVGVGVGVGVLAIGALVAAFVFWRKSRAKRAGPQQPYEMPLNGDFSPRFQNPQPYAGAQQPYDNGQPMYDASHQQPPPPQGLAGYYKPPETGETRGAELDGGQGHHFVPEAFPNNSVNRAELQ